jgi:hypothetical protein
VGNGDTVLQGITKLFVKTPNFTAKPNNSVLSLINNTTGEVEFSANQVSPIIATAATTSLTNVVILNIPNATYPIRTLVSITGTVFAKIPGVDTVYLGTFIAGGYKNSLGTFVITTPAVAVQLYENFAPNPNFTQFVTAGAVNNYQLLVNSGVVGNVNWEIQYVIRTKTLP